MELWRLVLVQILPLATRALVYVVVFRFRSIRATLLSCVIIAGTSSLVALIPFSVPMPVQFLLTMGGAMFLMSKLTDAEIFPDVLLIPFCVELTSAVFLEIILFPLLS